jgi:hypothetical protein
MIIANFQLALNESMRLWVTRLIDNVKTILIYLFVIHIPLIHTRLQTKPDGYGIGQHTVRVIHNVTRHQTENTTIT